MALCVDLGHIWDKERVLCPHFNDLGDYSVEDVDEVLVDHQVLLQVVEILETIVGKVALLLSECSQAIFINAREVIPFSIRDRVLAEMHSQAPILEVLMNQEVLKVGLDRFSAEREVLILGVCKDVIEQASESDDQLTNKTSNYEDTVSLGVWLSDVMDLGRSGVEVFVGRLSKSSHMDLVQENSDSMALTSSSSCGLPLSLLLFLFFQLAECLFFVLLTSLILLDHSVSVLSGTASHAEVEEIIEVVYMLDVGADVKLNLPIELGNE